jgi:phage virion morphogenesis protein
MASIALNFSLSNIAEQLDRLPAQFSDVDGLLDTIGGYLDSDAVQRFRAEETADGEKWQESERAASTPGALTLTDEGNLGGSITHNVSDGQLEHGSDEVYAAIHQFGGATGRNHATELVARPFLGIGDPQMREIGHILEDWGNDVIN